MDIAHSLKEMQNNASQYYYFFDRLNELGEFGKEKHIEESKKQYEEIVFKSVKSINKTIDNYNKTVKELFNNVELAKIPLKPLQEEINNVFKINAQDEKSYMQISPYLKEKMSKYILGITSKVIDELIAHKEMIDKYASKYETKTFPTIYKEDLEQIIDLYVMGYRSTALLVLGRVFEKIFMIWGYALIDSSKLQMTKRNLRNETFENVLEIFKEKGFITLKHWHVLSKIRLDRNVGGHYLSEKDVLTRLETEQEAEMTLMLALPLIKKYDKKIQEI